MKIERHTTRSGRPGRSAAPPWLIALLLLGAAAAHASADDGQAASPLPAGTSYYVGMPPYLPDERRDLTALRAWCRTLSAEGQRRAGTRLGADFLFSAAHAHALWLREEGIAASLYTEAASAYPAGDPSQGIVAFHHARREAVRGNVKRAADLLAATEAWLRQRLPRDLSAPDAHRWERLLALATRDVPLLRADLDEANGHFARAAEALETLAVDLAADDPRKSGRWYDRAARLRHRAGDKEAAYRLSDEALALDQSEADRAQRGIWRLYLEHGLLKDDGALGLWRTWPGETFQRDLMGFLRGLDGHPDAGFYYLTVASGAFAAGRKETALAVYGLALDNRDLVALARRTPTIWRGLLMAFPVALGSERLDEAERILQTVERIADEPIEEMDGYRMALSQAREDKQEREAARRRAEAERARGEEAGGPEDRGAPMGRIESGDAAPPGTAGGAEPAAEDGPPRWIWFAGAAFVLAGLFVALRRARARGA